MYPDRKYNNFHFNYSRNTVPLVVNKKKKLFALEKDPKKAVKLNDRSMKYYLNKSDRVFITGSNNINRKIHDFTQECKNINLLNFL